MQRYRNASAPDNGAVPACRYATAGDESSRDSILKSSGLSLELTAKTRFRKRTTKNGSDSDAAGVSDDELGALDKSNILPTTSRRTRGKVVNYAQLNADVCRLWPVCLTCTHDPAPLRC